MAIKFYRKDNNVFDNDTTMVTRSGTSRSKLVLLFLMLLIGAGLIFAGIRFLSLSSSTNKSPQAALTPTPFVTQAPTPTTEASPSGTITPTQASGSPTPSKKAAELTLEILNGSGKAGVASIGAAAFKKLGYTVSGTGNADNFTYEGYTIKAKKSLSSALAKLKQDVSTLGALTETQLTLPESSEVDAQVIIGK